MEYIYVCSWHIDVRRVANRQLFVGLFSRVVCSNAVLSKETMDAEYSEVLGLWEGEFGEGRRDSECSGSGESGVVMYSEPETHCTFPHLTVAGLWCVQLIYLPGCASLNCCT